MSVTIFGATGKLGSLIVDALLKRGTPPDEVIAAGRNLEKLAGLERKGVRTVRASYDDPDSLATALKGSNVALLISGNQAGARLKQHRNVIDAAKTANVDNLVYTSVLRTPTSSLNLTSDHKITEKDLQASGISVTVLRNAFYTDVFMGDFIKARDTGVIANSIAGGKIASAPRSDFAEATAITLLGKEHFGKTYELNGDTAWSYANFADTASQILGRHVRFESISPEAEESALLTAGSDAAAAQRMVDRNKSIRDGEMDRVGDDLAKILGRPTTDLRTVMSSWNV